MSYTTLGLVTLAGLAAAASAASALGLLSVLLTSALGFTASAAGFVAASLAGFLTAAPLSLAFFSADPRELSFFTAVGAVTSFEAPSAAFLPLGSTGLDVLDAGACAQALWTLPNQLAGAFA